MKAKDPQNFVPIPKCRRCDWNIPRIDAYVRLQKQQPQERAIQARIEGTTPQGREVFRKILFMAEHLLERGETLMATKNTVEAQLGRFETLDTEFKLLFSRFVPGSRNAAMCLGAT